MTTTSNVLFAGSREGYFYALDAASGKQLWKATLGAEIKGPPVTYEVGGRQFITVAAGTALFTFALRAGAI